MKVLRFTLLVLILVVVAQPALALRVSVDRLIFENKSRSQVINVINDSDEEQTYRISWKNYRMSEEKLLSEVKTPEELSSLKIAEPYLRYAPRRITIPAQSSQQVRIIARFASDMEEGEYRSHLHIVPEAKPAEFTAEQKQRAETKPVIKISTLTGISMPVFIRKGNLQVEGALQNAVLTRTDGDLKLSLDVVRQGNKGLFGDMDFVCTAGGKTIIAKQTAGIAVYPEVTRRRMNVVIPVPEQGIEACQTMTVSYRAKPDDSQYKGAEIATIAVTLQ